MNVYRSKKAEQTIIRTYDQLLAKWGVQVTEKDILGSYGTTHVVVCGAKDNPPLVLFHGVGDDTALMWLYNAAELSKHFCLFAVDTIGGPGKSRPDSRYGKDFDDITWIDEVLDGLGSGGIGSVREEEGYNKSAVLKYPILKKGYFNDKVQQRI